MVAQRPSFGDKGGMEAQLEDEDCQSASSGTGARRLARERARRKNSAATPRCGNNGSSGTRRNTIAIATGRSSERAKASSSSAST